MGCGIRISRNVFLTSISPPKKWRPHTKIDRDETTHQPMQNTRREFIKTGLGCAAAITLNPLPMMTAAENKSIPIGFQLYTVRGEFSRNVPDTLKKLAQIGYKAVEFW